jgi:hypothetical protein
VIDLPPDVPVANHPATAYCVVSAAHRYSLPPEGMLAVLLVEGGRPGTKRSNENGSFDLGVMQINTVWLSQASPLKTYVSYEALKNDLCTNIHTAAWIIASHLTKTSDIWRAVGMYHSPGNSSLASEYVRRVNGKLPQARKLLKSDQYAGYMDQFFGSRGTTYHQTYQTYQTAETLSGGAQRGR